MKQYPLKSRQSKERKCLKKVFDSNLNITNEFRRDMESSKNPIIALLIGIKRAGKSTRGNQLITGEVNPSDDKCFFKAEDGTDSVTKGSEYYGPVKLNELMPNQGIITHLNKEADIFIIDCEGLHDNNEECPGKLRQMTILLLQISTVNIYVSKDVMNNLNIPDIAKFFGISKIIPEGGVKFETGFVIMVRDVGVKGGNQLSLKEYDAKRHEQDKKEERDLKKKLRTENIKFTEDNFKLFTQPDFNRFQQSYLNSHKECINFIEKIINKRDEIPGSILLQVIEKSRSLVNRLSNLNDPNIDFRAIFNQVLEEIIQIPERKVRKQIMDTITEQTISSQFTNFNRKTYIRCCIKEFTYKFSSLCDKQLNGISSWGCCQRKNKAIEAFIEDRINSAYKSVMKKKGIPLFYRNIIQSIKESVAGELRNSDGSDLRRIDSNFEQWIFNYQESASQTFENSIQEKCPELMQEYIVADEKRKLMNEISTYMNQQFERKCNECPPYPQTVEEARMSGQTGSSVQLWTSDRSSSHIWSVNSRDEIIIDVSVTKYTEKFYDSSRTGRKSEKVSYQFDLKRMLLTIFGGNLVNCQTRSKHSMLGRGHYSETNEYIEIYIYEDILCFYDGSRKKTIGPPSLSYKETGHYCESGNTSFALTFN